MKLKHKIFLAFMTLTMMIFVLGGAGIFYLKNNNETINEAAHTQEIVSTYENVSFQTVRANAAIRGYMIYEEQYMIDNHYEIRDTLHEQINKLEALGVSGSEFDEYLAQLTSWEASIDEDIIPLIERGESEEAKIVSEPILGKGSSELVMFSREMTNNHTENSQKDFEHIVSTGTQMFYTVLIVALVSIITAFTLSTIFGRGLTKSIQHIAEKINVFATGDFNTKIDINSKDEFNTLAQSFNSMTEKLRETMSEVNNTSIQVASMSEEFSASSEEISSATNEITHSIIDISEGIDDQNEMTDNINKLADDVLEEIKNILENVRLTRSRVEDTDTISEEGKNDIAVLYDKISAILSNSDQITEDIITLESQTDEIAKSIIAIKGIADQTNLLALNASIEAARAGESGQGFAVVAEEVRNLAVASNEASVTIEETIKNISSQIKRTVENIVGNNKTIQDGQEQITTYRSRFDNIIDSVSNVKEQTDYVQQSIDTIFNNIEELVQQIESANKISQNSSDQSQGIAAASEEQNASMVEVAEAANELARLAARLQTLIQNYKF